MQSVPQDEDFAETGDTQLRPGTSFGSRYRIEKLLGEGGMGAVYKAYDSELGRTVALKLVKKDLASSRQIMQRFKQELLLASRISHKNILRIHDLGEVDGIKFITMAFVEGTDLAGLIEKDGGLSLERALKFAKQLCSALDAAHSEGVVHRDLKPQNILIDQSDQLFVSDFGLAKSLEPDMTAMTQAGQVLGTPRYMSPEQVEAKEIDQRSDLYSLGLIFYEMFTAELPFRAESTFQLMYKHVNEPPKDPRTICAGLPEYIANVIMKCLEKDPAKRYQSAQEILADLEAQSAAPVSAPAGSRTISIQVRKPSRPAWWIGAGAVVVLAALAFSIPGVRHRIFPAPAGAGNPAQATIQHYMAVLPFRVNGDEQDAKYIADGVVDSLSAKLAGLKNVYVAPSNAVTSAAKQADPQKLARTLGVKLLLRGTVTTGAKDAIAITVTLDDTANKGQNLLHQDFTGVRQDLLTLEDQIFNKLVSTLAIKESNEEMVRSTARPTENIGAYELYLKGRNVWRSAQNPKDLDNAISLFNQAIKVDPRFALAYAGLADAERRMWDQTKDAVWTQRALGAAQQAQSLNDNLPEVHFTLGSIYTATGRTAEAVAELQRALQLAPNSDESLRRLGTAYLNANQPQEAIAAYTKATEVNPYLWTNFNQLGVGYFRLGQNDRALQEFKRVSELAPDRSEGWANTGAVYYQQGKWNECIPMFQKAIQLQPNATSFYNLGTTYLYLGRYTEAAQAFAQAVSMVENNARFRINLADAYRWSGQQAKAAATYEEAITLAYKSIQVNPQNSEALGYLAICYAKKGDARQAASFIARARAINRESNELMYEEAIVHALAGQTKAALASLQEALQKGYPLKQAEGDPELKQIRELPEFGQVTASLSNKSAK
ncbi:MAG TPA: tetratricopeptide repeat protein [Bryobacteraceae bacterium]|nr:tetratricopeptide repeat protein [Bryobacteraceae bacterium]